MTNNNILYSKQNKISSKIVLLLFLTGIIFVIIFSFINYKLQRNIIINEENKQLMLVKNTINTTMNEEMETTYLSLLGVAENPQIKKLFYEKDREGLKKILIPVWNSWKPYYAHFNFNLLPAVSFLRLQRLNDYGDDISSFRPTILKAVSEKKIVSGLEEGKAGFGFRVVMPVFYNNRLIGTNELGKEFDKNFLKKLYSFSKGDYYIYRNPEKKMKYFEGYEWIKNPGPLASFGKKDVYYVSDEIINKVYKGQTKIIKTSQYSVILVPFYDFSGFISGYFKCVFDRTEIINRLHENLFITILVQLISIMIFCFIVFLMIDKVIMEKLALIHEKIINVETDLSTRIHIKSNDEIGEIAKIFNQMISTIEKLVKKEQSTSISLRRVLEGERYLREIIIETRKLNNHDEMYNYLLNKLINLFNTNRSLHLHHDKNNNLFVQNEVIKDQSLQPLLNQSIASAEYLSELSPEKISQVSVVKDVNQEIFIPELKEYLIKHKIQAYLLYPTSRIYEEEKNYDILGYTLICHAEPKMWEEDEIEFFKLIVDTVSIIFLEFKQRQEIEEIKKTFIATLTHDLKSPIIAEQSALEAMISKRLECSEEYLQDIYKTNKSLLRIVNNLLSIYHYESGKALLNKTETNIKELIEDSTIALKYLAADKESQIYFDIQEDLPLINVDNDEISRVFTNLIENAIKHTRKGTHIKLSASRKDNNILIAIQDNGEGISKEHVARIFQRYPTEKRKIGTGLGLYLSKQIIEAHNGEIWFESQEGEGTTFYFTLPV